MICKERWRMLIICSDHAGDMLMMHIIQELHGRPETAQGRSGTIQRFLFSSLFPMITFSLIFCGELFLCDGCHKEANFKTDDSTRTV